MNKVIAITNQKGGVGKTTTAYNLAYALSLYDKKILVVDMDPQGNCSQALGIDSTILKNTISDLLLENSSLRHTIHRTKFEKISIIPANLTLAMVESSLFRTTGSASFSLLKEKLFVPETEEYDFILIDCPPSLSFLSLNALNAANNVLVPVQCEFFALDALAQLLSSIAGIQRTSNPDLDILGLVLTMYDQRTNLCNEICEAVRENFKDKVFTTIIPRNISVSEAIYNALPVGEFKPNSAGALAYHSLAREVLSHVEEKQAE